MVREWPGKEFPYMRQNERRIKFIGVGDAVRAAGWLKGDRCICGLVVNFYSLRTRQVPMARVCIRSLVRILHGTYVT